MADGIRGKHFESFPPDVQKGIVLHRAIDTFTDAHPIFRESTKRLHGKFHHYSGVIVDVFYDHFLAKNWTRYSSEDLVSFAENFYQSLQDNHEILTDKTRGMLPYMMQYNWLVSYETVTGIERILTQMDHRIKNNSNMRFSIEDLKLFYTEFEEEFTLFFEELRAYCGEKLREL
jgi:acyl carrier protein phosphodiesterase